jgi:hypothetical protein
VFGACEEIPLILVAVRFVIWCSCSVCSVIALFRVSCFVVVERCILVFRAVQFLPPCLNDRLMTVYSNK